MRAEDLTLHEIVDFAEGRVSLHGRRLVLQDTYAFALLRKDLINMVGLEQARSLLSRFGHFWGEADAAAMKRIFEWDNLAEWLKAGPRMHALQGLVRPMVKALDFDQSRGFFHMEVVWHDSAEADQHLSELGPADHPVCWVLQGYASGYCSYCLGIPIYFREQRCRGMGDRVCMAVGKDETSWGDEIETCRSRFQTEDIRNKVQTLTVELRQKTQEIKQQRRRLALLEARAGSAFVEVHSDIFARVIELATRVAAYDSSVLITGESGTGKEVIARYIHKHSLHANGPFVAVNCGALPDTLLESELFGHTAGAFTGAVRERVGLFAEAHQGTILLDEIGDISPAMQVKLLRVLQTKEIMRVGDSKTRKVNVRVIAATNRTLAEEVEKGTFREDLLYRLRVIEIEVPPLRDRREDILPLARHFVQQFARRLKKPNLTLDGTCVDYLQAHTWPGNVRELENDIERGAILAHNDRILPEHLPLSIVHRRLQDAPANSLTRTLAEVEHDHIEVILRLTNGNRTRAAGILGISQATLWRKLKRGGGVGG